MVESVLPLPVERAMRTLGRDIALARRRRRLTQASLAERAGTSVATLRRLEAGEPSVALAVVARVLHVFGELDAFARLLDSSADTIGLALADERLPQRVRSKKPAPAGRATRGAL